MIKRIMVGLAMTPQTAAEVREAVKLAALHKAELTGVTVADLDQIGQTGPVPIGAGQAAAELTQYRVEQALKHTEKAIRLFRRECRKAEIQSRVVREESKDPFAKLLSLWRYQDLTILGNDSLVYEGLIDAPEDALIRLIGKGVRPLLTVCREFSPPSRVLIGYNGSMTSAKALKRFLQLNLWPNLSLRVAVFRDSVDEDPERLAEDAGEYCRVYGFETETVVRPGSAQIGLIQEADEWDAQVIVAGNSLRRLLLRKVFGDTVMSLIRRSNRALFLTQ